MANHTVPGPQLPAPLQLAHDDRVEEAAIDLNRRASLASSTSRNSAFGVQMTSACGPRLRREQHHLQELVHGARKPACMAAMRDISAGAL
jgi:hypothetical protein